MGLVEVARGVLVVAVAMSATDEPREHDHATEPAGDADGSPDRVCEGGERQRGGYLRSTTIVLTDAVTPSATSTTTT